MGSVAKILWSHKILWQILVHFHYRIWSKYFLQQSPFSPPRSYRRLRKHVDARLRTRFRFKTDLEVIALPFLRQEPNITDAYPPSHKQLELVRDGGNDSFVSRSSSCLRQFVRCGRRQLSRPHLTHPWHHGNYGLILGDPPHFDQCAIQLLTRYYSRRNER